MILLASEIRLSNEKNIKNKVKYLNRNIYLILYHTDENDIEFLTTKYT